MTILIVVNDAPYGSERPFNALRLAEGLLAEGIIDLRVFLLADGVGCAKAGQKVPAGHDDIQHMIQSLVVAGARVGLCGTCMDVRGLTDADLVAGAARRSMKDLACWVLESDRALVF